MFPVRSNNINNLTKEVVIRYRSETTWNMSQKGLFSLIQLMKRKHL